MNYLPRLVLPESLPSPADWFDPLFWLTRDMEEDWEFLL